MGADDRNIKAIYPRCSPCHTNGAYWHSSIENDMKQSFITFPTKAKGSFNKDQSSLFLFSKSFLFACSLCLMKRGGCGLFVFRVRIVAGWQLNLLLGEEKCFLHFLYVVFWAVWKVGG